MNSGEQVAGECLRVLTGDRVGDGVVVTLDLGGLTLRDGDETDVSADGTAAITQFTRSTSKDID